MGTSSARPLGVLVGSMQDALADSDILEPLEQNDMQRKSWEQTGLAVEWWSGGTGFFSSAQE